MPHDDGRKSRCRLVTMMTKRSSHMPMLTTSEIMNSSGTFVRTRLNHSSCGVDDVAEDQRPVDAARTGPVMRFHDHEPLVRVAAVPGHERLDHVAVGDDQAGRQHDLRHVLQVPHRDEVLAGRRPRGAESPASAPWRSRSRSRRRRSTAGRSWCASPGRCATAKSKLTTVCTETTSGVARPASSRYAVS